MATQHERRYEDAKGKYDTAKTEGDRQRYGREFKEQVVDRAERREWAHKRRGDERRFNE